MSDDGRVVCGRHGSTPQTFVCRHVAFGVACGFHSAGDEYGPWPDAWCDACQDVLAAAGEWTDAAAKQADIELLCTHCYVEARDRNGAVPPLGRGEKPRLSPEEEKRLLRGACRAGQRCQDAATARWGLGDYARWDYDSGAGTLTLSKGQRAPLVADVRLVGSYSTRSSTFQWSWVLYPDGNAQVDEVAQLRAFGEVRGVSLLTTELRECDEAEAWEMTTLAGYLLGCQAFYRAPFDHLYWFMLLRNFRMLA